MCICNGNYISNFLRFYPLFQFFQQGCIVFGRKDAEAQEGFIQESEGRCIADEHFFHDAFFKQIVGSHLVCFQFQQDEVGFGRESYDVFPCGKFIEGFSSFVGNQFLCRFMEIEICKNSPGMPDWRTYRSPDGCRGLRRIWMYRG